MVNRFLLSFLLCLAAIWPLSAESDGGYDGKVRRLDIINWTHTDYGFTDNPVILLELQKRYIDIVIEYAERSAKNQEGERFTWTVEALDPLWQWWQEASDSSRKRFLKAVDNLPPKSRTLYILSYDQVSSEETAVRRALSCSFPAVSVVD